MAKWAPKCMSAEEHADWQRANGDPALGSERAVYPCADCPAAWASERRYEGTCNRPNRRVARRVNRAIEVHRTKEAYRRLRDEVLAVREMRAARRALGIRKAA